MTKALEIAGVGSSVGERAEGAKNLDGEESRREDLNAPAS